MVPTRDAFSGNNDGVDSKVVDGRDKAGHEEKEAGLRLSSLFELRRQVDRFNPTGKSLRVFRNALSSPFCKNISVFARPKSVH
jgi:hypothetical protein